MKTFFIWLVFIGAVWLLIAGGVGALIFFSVMREEWRDEEIKRLYEAGDYAGARELMNKEGREYMDNYLTLTRKEG